MYLTQTQRPNRLFASGAPSGQRGVVLLIALIILVALTLAGVALIRSVDTANLIAGNMSFHQSATQSGERSTEQALNNWLLAHIAIGDTALFDHNAANGYRAAREDPAAGESWDTFWNKPTTGLATQAVTGAPDAAGNTVSYVIHRLCETTGAPHLTNCSKPPAGANAGGSFSAGGAAVITTNQVYYRVTTRIAGPRRTVAYLQTIVAL